MQTRILEVIGGGPLSYLIIFIGAAILSLSSCTIVRVPIVIGYISGTASNRREGLSSLMGFVSGLILTYTILGVILGIAAGFISKSIRLSSYFYRIAGGILLLLGLYLLDFLPLKKILKCESGISKGLKGMSFLGALFFGITFAFFEAPVCPCCGPILFLIATKAIASANFIYALSIFLTYALGQSLPIFLIGLSTTFLKFIEGWTCAMEGYVKALAGVLLFYIGVYLIWIG